MNSRIWRSHNGQPEPLTRRTKMRWAAGLCALSMAALSACGSSGTTHSSTPSTSGSTSGSGGSSSGAPSGSPYTIHAILSVTGSASFLGAEEKASLLALEKEVNSTGGIQGHPLKFAIDDNQTNASTSVSLASPLIGKVPLMIVGSLTTVDRPVDDMVTSNGPVIYDLSPGDHPKRGSFVYSSSNSTTSQTEAFINFCKTKGWTKIGAITSTDASGQDGWTNLQKAVAGSNGAVTVTDHETFNPTAVSVTTQLSKIKATNPQAIVIWTTGTPVGTVFKGMQQLGMESLPTMTTNGNDNYAEMQKLSNVLPNQLYFPSSPFQANPSNLSGQQKTVVEQFVNAIKASGQKVPDEGDALAWDPGFIFVNALRKLGVNATAAQIHNYIQSQTNFVGINGTYNFQDTSIPDNRGLSINSIYVIQWSKSQNNWVQVSGAAGKGTAS